VFGQSLLHVDFSRVSTMYYHSTLCLFVRQHGKAEFFRDGISEPIGAIARVVFRVARWYEVRVSQGIRRLFGSCPLRSKTLVFPGVFRISSQLLWLSCLSMPVHACRCCPYRNRRLVRCLSTW
jgi:hypothetical protein